MVLAKDRFHRQCWPEVERSGAESEGGTSDEIKLDRRLGPGQGRCLPACPLFYFASTPLVFE